ncbi:MAG: hypothetical protein R2794_04165 [Chitinophagales bacterium]
MKPIVYKLTFILLLVSFSSVIVTAQTAEKGTATINSAMVITLNTETPLVADYDFDISAMHFVSKEAAEEYFAKCRDNIVNYTVDFEKHTATIHLMLEFMEPRGWTVADYNAYLAKVSSRYQSVYSVVNE